MCSFLQTTQAASKIGINVQKCQTEKNLMIKTHLKTIAAGNNLNIPPTYIIKLAYKPHYFLARGF